MAEKENETTARPTALEPAEAPMADAIDNEAKIENAVAEANTPDKPSTAHKAKEAVKKEAGLLRGHAEDRVREAANQGKGKAIGAASTVSSVLGDTAASIDEKFGSEYGDYARFAQGKLDDMAKQVETMDVDEFVVMARDFVRKNPAIALGTATAAGFALMRLLKAGIDEED